MLFVVCGYADGKAIREHVGGALLRSEPMLFVMPPLSYAGCAFTWHGSAFHLGSWGNCIAPHNLHSHGIYSPPDIICPTDSWGNMAVTELSSYLLCPKSGQLALSLALSSSSSAEWFFGLRTSQRLGISSRKVILECVRNPSLPVGIPLFTSRPRPRCYNEGARRAGTRLHLALLSVRSFSIIVVSWLSTC